MRSDHHVARRWSPWVGKPPTAESAPASAGLPVPVISAIQAPVRKVVNRSSVLPRLPVDAGMAGARPYPPFTYPKSHDFQYAPIKRRKRRLKKAPELPELLELPEPPAEMAPIARVAIRQPDTQSLELAITEFRQYKLSALDRALRDEFDEMTLIEEMLLLGLLD